MSKKMDILLKSITLLHREKELEVNGQDDSSDLVKTVLSLFGNSNRSNLMGGESSVLEDLKHLIEDMINNPDNYDKISLLQSLELIFKDSPDMLKVVNNAIDRDFSQASLKRTIISLRNTLNNYYKEEELKNAISKASYQITTGRLDGESITDYTQKLVTTLEALTTQTKTKDPGIVDELDMSDEEGMSLTINKVRDSNLGGNKLITGWKEVNEITQGGFKRGESWCFYALQHKYKSGFTRSIFMQLPLHNKPIMDDPNKKPLMVFISFEDDADVMIDFMYKYLYYNEHDKLPDLTEITSAEIAKYIKDKLTMNGYNIKIMRVNPSEWTYKSLFNKILEYEANGYEVHAVVVDYLSKLPTTGCTMGPTGTDVRDLFNRVRNFMSARSILFITPHQLSTEAKQLIRNGVPDVNFVKEIAGKGFSEGSKAIDNVLDGELYLHIARIKRQPYLTVQRGKHRTPNILPEEKMYFTLPFPKGAPIKENLNDDTDPSFGGVKPSDIGMDEKFDF